MEYTLKFSDRSRYTKALSIISKNPRYTISVYGRDYAPNIIRPWSTMFYITFRVEA